MEKHWKHVDYNLVKGVPNTANTDDTSDPLMLKGPHGSKRSSALTLCAFSSSAGPVNCKSHA
eukprot:1139933-Pelagomonas_calceolata.AAC.1